MMEYLTALGIVAGFGFMGVIRLTIEVENIRNIVEELEEQIKKLNGENGGK